MCGRITMTGHDRWGKRRLMRGGSPCARRRAAFAAVAVLAIVSGAPSVPAQTPTSSGAETVSAAATDADNDARPPLNRKPVLIRSAVPEYPDEFAGSGVSAEIVVTMLVDRLGHASHIRIEGSPDPAFNEAVMAALSHFEFLPAIRNGRVTNADVRVTLQLTEDFGDKALVDYEGGRIELLASASAEPPEVAVHRLFAARPAFPLEMLAADKPGEVVVEFTIGDGGRPENPKILESTYKEFTDAVKGALALWRYSPALRGSRPVPTALRYRVSFQPEEVPEATRAMARRLLAGDTSDLVPDRQLDAEPRARSRIMPIAPDTAGDSGHATHRAEVAFVVDAKGKVRLPRVLRASDPVSGYTALAAVGYWTFEPALRKKTPVPVLVTLPFRF